MTTAEIAPASPVESTPIEEVEEHHDEDIEEYGHLESMAPAPSYWPLVLTLTMTFVPVGVLTFIWGASEFVRMAGLGIVGLALLVSIVPAMGWCHSVIVDKWAGHFGETAQGNDLVLGTKLFFLSEIAIFGSLFAYYFMMLWDATHTDNWPMPGTPHIHLQLPAIGLVLLLISSVTCHFAENAVHGGKRGLSKSWLLVTMALGFTFLFLQGWEWGYLINHYGFITSTNTFATVFFILTGFHGLHVMTGLIMLFLVYGRLEIGHYSPRRHFSFKAASWYWHLVDVVWIFVFVFVYCFQG